MKFGQGPEKCKTGSSASRALSPIGQQAVRFQERDPAVDINGLQIHLALPGI
jgi:hypothetical protein